MERNIPHIRDIFSSSSRKKSGEFQDLCVYDKSPRSRRKLKNFDFTSEPDEAEFRNPPSRKKNEKGKENQHSKASDDTKLLPDNKNNTNNPTKSSHYSSKTLTERDIRHLERHLSMKKTIRKQISRNLAQAFMDNPGIFEPDGKKDSSVKQDYGITLTRPKLQKSEKEALDLLKYSIDDRDSGHSSPTNEVLAQDEEPYDDYNGPMDGKGWNSGHRSSETKLLSNHDDSRMDNSSKSHGSEKKSSSIWKMFSNRNKGKR